MPTRWAKLAAFGQIFFGHITSTARNRSLFCGNLAALLPWDGAMERKIRPWEDPNDPMAGFYEYDTRPEWECSDPAAGVSPMHALYHFVDSKKGAEFIALDLEGYGDESNIDPTWWPEELAKFQKHASSWYLLRIDLVGRLYGKLRKGDLIAKGFSNQMPLDTPRRPINPERWIDLELNVRQATASGPGIEITQILIFAGSKGTVPEPKRPATFSPAALRQWYIKRVAAFEAAGKKSSRDDDVNAANDQFGHVPRSQVRALRAELAPKHWTREGRPRQRRTAAGGN